MDAWTIAKGILLALGIIIVGGVILLFILKLFGFAGGMKDDTREILLLLAAFAFIYALYVYYWAAG